MYGERLMRRQLWTINDQAVASRRTAMTERGNRSFAVRMQRSWGQRPSSTGSVQSRGNIHAIVSSSHSTSSEEEEEKSVYQGTGPTDAKPISLSIAFCQKSSRLVHFVVLSIKPIDWNTKQAAISDTRGGGQHNMKTRTSA